MAGYTYDDYLQRLTVQDLLKDAGYVRNRKDGLRYPSYVRLDEHGQRVRGDKFIVTQGGRRCFQPPVQKTSLTRRLMVQRLLSTSFFTAKSTQ